MQENALLVCCICLGNDDTINWLVLAFDQLGLQGSYHCAGNFILHLKDIGEFAIVVSRPKRMALFGIYQVGCNPDVVINSTYTAFQDSAHIQFLANATKITLIAFKLESRGFSGNPQIRNPRQHIQQFDSQTFGKILLVPAGTGVGEWQNGY